MDDKDHVRHIAEEFLENNWPIIAAMAYRNYGEHGRGAVVLDIRGERVLNPDLRYDDRSELGMMVNIAPDFAPGLFYEVDRYEPKESLIFIYLSDGMSYYVNAGKGDLLPPIEAAQKAERQRAFEELGLPIYIRANIETGEVLDIAYPERVIEDMERQMAEPEDEPTN